MVIRIIWYREAEDDILGRKLQDLGLKVNKRAPKK